jgi:hypothetical protein
VGALTRRLWVLGAVGMAAGVMGSCLRDTTGPGGLRARLALGPVFESRAAAVVPFELVRVTLVRPGTQRSVVDTVIPFPAGAAWVELTVSVALEAPSEEFLLFLRLVNAAGDTVFRNDPYPQTIAAVAGRSGPVVEASLRYTGVGADAAAVVIATPDTVVTFGGTLVLTAAALGLDGLPIAGTPIAWSSLDPLRAGVPDRASPQVVGGVERGPARVVAQLLTGPADTVVVTAQPAASQVVKVTGDGQQALAGAPLPSPLKVRVTAADGLGVRVPVTFRALAAGASVVDGVVASDSNGFAQTFATLDSVVGAQTFEAAVVGVPAAVFTAGALTHIATVVVATSTPLLDALGATASFSAVAQDASGAPLPVTFTWSSSEPRVAAIDSATGVATATGNGKVTITATAQGMSGTASLDVAQSVTQLVFATQPGSITAGAVMSPPVEVRALDAGGSVATNFQADVTLARGDLIDCFAILLGTTTAPAAQGVAKFADLTVRQACPSLQLRATAGNVTALSNPFDVVPGPAAALAFRVEPSDVIVLSPITPAVEVAVYDQFGNLVPTWTAPVTVKLGNNPLGAALGGMTTVMPVGGVASFRDLSVGLASPGYTLVATSTSGPSPAPAAATSQPFSVFP